MYFWKYSGTSPYGHLGNMVTSLLWPPFFRLAKWPTFPYENPPLMWSPINQPTATF